MKYSDILAAIVHDVKNSLGVVVNHVDEMLDDPQLPAALRARAGAMEQEMRRANGQLVQILTLYKLDNQRLVPVIDEHNLYDFFEEILIEEAPLAKVQGIELDMQVDESLNGYFDQDLVRNVLGSTIGNAKRYTHSRILLSAEQQGDYLVLRIQDDGEGFNDDFLQTYRQEQDTSGRDLSEGRTHLGFFFADQIARAHENRGQHGYLRLSNGHDLAGGCFELWLP
ncbi:MAG: HAMP domain-containing sensor histidine kinase [Chromatiales bacterium]|jgi:signal transduction histidine kinase